MFHKITKEVSILVAKLLRATLDAPPTANSVATPGRLGNVLHVRQPSKRLQGVNQALRSSDFLYFNPDG